MIRAKIIGDLAIALAVGGDCLADVGLLRTQPHVFGAVASDPTVFRLVNTLAAINTAWAAAGDRAPDHDADHPVIIDLNASLVGAHSDKERAAPTYKRGFGFHPLSAFVDHGLAGTGEPVAILLRPGSNKTSGSSPARPRSTLHLLSAFQTRDLEPSQVQVSLAGQARRCMSM